MKSILIEAYGGPEQLKLHDVSSPTLAAGQALVQVTAAGVNFMDIGVRTGQFWKDRPLPLVPGVEGAGRVIALGDGVDTVAVGQRVSWVYAPGSYCERIAIDAQWLVPIPETITDETAAALMMQGVTASHFATDFYAIQPGDVALVHAAAGGVGLLLTQMIKLRGGRVIARVSNQEKAEIARSAGADDVIVEAGSAFAEQVRALTGGAGVKVVYDGSGAATFPDSLASLGRHGVLAYYGPGLGKLAPVDLLSLSGSVLIGYPTFADHIPTREALLSRTRQLFEWVANGDIKLRIGRRYPLGEAAQAHIALASRLTSGKLLLIP